MDKRRLVLFVICVGVLIATVNVLSNLVATMVPPALVKTYSLTIAFIFISLCIVVFWLTTYVAPQWK
jgi:polyferredoxin